MTVTWSGDADAAALEGFDDALGGSSYAAATLGEYGVTIAPGGDHVHLATAPDTLDDAGARALVAAHAAWPTPSDALYVLYPPSSTKVARAGGDACASTLGAWHDVVTDAASDAGARRIPFVVAARCPQTGSAVDLATAWASHAIVEAATNPDPEAPALAGFDAPHFAWTLYLRSQVESAHACDFEPHAFLQGGADFPYVVARAWSNRAARAGHDPCAPSDGGAAYFTAVPLTQDEIAVNLSSVGGAPHVVTRGLRVAVGETKTFALGLTSDARTEGWSLRAAEGNPSFGTPTDPHLILAIDRATGENGQIAHLTVTVRSRGSIGAELVTLVSSIPGGASHFTPLLVGAP